MTAISFSIATILPLTTVPSNASSSPYVSFNSAVKSSRVGARDCMEAIGSPNCALLFGQRRLWVRVDVQESADRKGPHVIRAWPLSPLLAAEPAYLAGDGSPRLIAMWGAHAASASR